MRPETKDEWTRKHDDPNQPAFIARGVGVRLNPESLEDIVSILTTRTDRPVAGFRSCGSHWALSEAVADRGYTGGIIETDLLNRTLYDVVPECLSDEVMRDLVEQAPAKVGEWDESAYNLYHVEAGIRICDLYSRLDRQDPRWAKLPTDGLRVEALTGAWALPTLGSAGGQTIAGAASTSTHGGDLALPPADAIQAIHLIAPGAHQFWIERSEFSESVSTPMSDPTKLRRALGRIEVVQDDGLLNAALVGVGRFGVIYSVVLRVVRQYGLREVRRHAEWDLVQRLLVDPASDLYSQRYLQVLVNPFSRFRQTKRLRSDSHSCWITQRLAVPIPWSPPATWQGRSRRAAPTTTGSSPPIDERPHDIYSVVCHSRVNFAPVFEDALAAIRDVEPLAALKAISTESTFVMQPRSE